MQCLGFSSFAEFNTYLTFVLLGMSIMMVVSAVTSAPSFITEYYRFATGDPDAVCETPIFWDNANTFFNVGTYVAQVTMEALALTPFVRRIPLRLRLFVGLLIPFLELLIIVIIPAVTIPTQNGAIVVLMVVSVLGGLSKALCDSSTNALVGPFPTKFMNGALWGLSISALFMSIIQIILKVSMGETFDEVLTQSRIYFGIGIAVQLFALVQMLIMHRNPFAQKYIAEFRMMAIKNGDIVESDEANAQTISGEPVMEEEAVSSELQEKRLEVDDAEDEVRAVGNNGAVLKAVGDADHMVDEDQNNQMSSSDQMLQASAFSVFVKVWPMLACTFVVFFTSLLLFPGLFFSIDFADGWYLTIIVLLFNVGDFVARLVLMVRWLRPSPLVVVIGTAGRLIIVPFLVLCVRGIISGHALPYVLITLVGLTNGYFGTMSVIHCPRTPTLRLAGERSLAAILAGISLMLGLCAGSNFALLLNLTI